MAQMMNVYDLDRKRVAVLQNAYNITEEQTINQIYTLKFDIPSTDDKIQFCQPFAYYRFGNGKQMYRQIKNPKQNSDISVDTITCEHVIATLCDNVMFGSHTYGGKNVKTREVINYILSFQTTQNWVLGECDFDYGYEYGWEQENLLNALYSVPKVFVDPYMWTFDLSVYPWRVNLKKIDTSARPSYYIRAKTNLISDSAEIDYTNICTRLYPLGYGEGINQLTIKDVNDDIPYLEAPAAIKNKYGVKEKVLVDRQFEDAATLKAYAQTVLDAMTTPSLTRKFNVVDLYPLTSADIDNAECGKICKLTGDGSIAYVTKTIRVLDDPGNLQIDLSTKATDVVAQLADLADRVRIESVYAQGATQLYQHSKDANATPDKGMIVSLYFPSEMKQINKVLLRLKLNKFRSYSQTTETNAAITKATDSNPATSKTTDTSPASTKTTSAGGNETDTSEAGGGASISTTSGPSSESTTRNGLSVSYFTTHPASVEGYSGYTDITNNYDHRHYNVLGNHIHTIPGDLLYHSHQMPHTHNMEISVPAHTHTIHLPDHTHTVQIPAHNHTVQIPSHTHNVEIPAHKHNIAAGIYESGSPTGFDIYIGDTKKATVSSTSYDGDIVTWLLGSDGLVPRNRWIDMEIRPNDNAYVVSSVFIQGFVQSRGGGNY